MRPIVYFKKKKIYPLFWGGLIIEKYTRAWVWSLSENILPQYHTEYSEPRKTNIRMSSQRKEDRWRGRNPSQV